MAISGVNPQLQNPNMAAFMGAQGGQPQPQASPMGSQQPQQGQQQQVDPKIMALVQQLMKMGRGGDTLLAHLTPGEMEVPPEVQTPKVLATLKKAYEAKGVSPAQFTAGSPQSSINPQTGMPEYNFMSAFLPAALGLGAAVVAPELLPGLAASNPLLLSSVAGGLGNTVGGLAAGQTPTQAILSGAGAGAGGYALGSLAGGAADAAAGAAKVPTMDQAMAMKIANIDPASAGFGAASQSPNLAQMAQSSFDSARTGLPGVWNQAQAAAMDNVSPSAPSGFSILGHQINPYQSIGAAAGGYLGGQLGASPKPNQPNYPPGFNTPMTPFSQLGSPRQMLGQNSNTAVNANFSGYNPATNFPASYNFFPKM